MFTLFFNLIGLIVALYILALPCYILGMICEANASKKRLQDILSRR